MKKALITGITGQDGSYLAELLLSKGYEVHGLVRKTALEDPEHRFTRISGIKDKVTLHPGNLESYSRIVDIISKVKPDECFHLAAQSFVGISFEDAFSTLQTNIMGTLHLLEAIRTWAPNCRFYFAGSSEMFGKVCESPQNEETKFHPRSPYGVSKVTGFDLTRNYREAYGLFACNGMLFNHEGPRRGHEFVTRKITRSVASIKRGETNVLVLGNLEARRDWGFSGEFVEAMWLMLQQDKPDDYVIGTGETHSIREFVDAAFEYAGVAFEYVNLHGLSVSEADAKVKELEMQKDKVFVVQHPRWYRPAEVDLLLADPAKAKDKLGWEPKVKFDSLVKMMVDRDLED